MTRRTRSARRRRRHISGRVQDLTQAQWMTIREAWGGCAYCGAVDVPLQKDCVQPISHGGRYTADNVVPACRSCNASKCNGEVTGWLRRKHLDESAFLLRHREVLEILAADEDPDRTTRPVVR